MKKNLVALGLVALTSAASAQWGTNRPKEFEVWLGGAFFSANKAIIGDSGFMAELDYFMSKYEASGNSFIGLRGVFGSGGTSKLNAYGLHYGTKVSLSGDGGPQPLYLRAGIGYYRTEVGGTTSNGVGGFAGLGYGFGMENRQGTSFNVEVGYFFGPSVTGVNPRHVYGAIGFRF